MAFSSMTRIVRSRCVIAIFMTHCSNFGKRARLKSVHKYICTKNDQTAAFGRSIATRILSLSKAGVDTVIFGSSR
ncbi:hypothetical protein RHECNPAF_1740090 [Rhizobium etli CNPAF512]|nr:hypothetical protein RHECNPAF_1740090 [Rhizobium etli CNPAF512]